MSSFKRTRFAWHDPGFMGILMSWPIRVTSLMAVLFARKGHDSDAPLAALSCYIKARQAAEMIAKGKVRSIATFMVLTAVLVTCLILLNHLFFNGPAVLSNVFVIAVSVMLVYCGDFLMNYPKSGKLSDAYWQSNPGDAESLSVFSDFAMKFQRFLGITPDWSPVYLMEEVENEVRKRLVRLAELTLILEEATKAVQAIPGFKASGFTLTQPLNQRSEFKDMHEFFTALRLCNTSAKPYFDAAREKLASAVPV